MKKIILDIKGMSCSACSNSLEKYLNKQEGIIECYVNLVTSKASISYSDKLTVNDLIKYVKEAGFDSPGEYDENKINKKENKYLELIIYTILAILIMYISMSHMLKLPLISILNINTNPINYTITLLILVVPFLIYGLDILKNGYKNLVHNSPNMDTLVSLGVLSSLIYSIINTIQILKGNYKLVHNLYFESVAIVIYFIKLGRYITDKSKQEVTSSIKDLVTITPYTALKKENDIVKEVTLDEIKKGDILVCKPGMKIAVDGIITKGITHIDESFITGESIPNKKEKNDAVLAGTINIEGYIEYKAEKIGKETTISEIVRLVVNSINTKSSLSHIADKVSGIFVKIVIIVAVLTFISHIILSNNIDKALTYFVSVLVVSCPCSLGLATPLAVITSLSLTAKNGILVKSSKALENVCNIDTFVFDKTGSLTYGTLKINKIFNYSNYSKEELLNIVSNIENLSNHPIASAFKNNKQKLKVKNYEEISGIGLKAQINNKEYYLGNSNLINNLKIENNKQKDELFLQENANSIVYVIENKEIIALIGVKDIIRKEAKQVIKELINQSKKVIMLTGDNEITSKVIAKELNIDNVISNVTPKEKGEIINKLKENSKVMMIGDGINDAVSLVNADIGLSLSVGSDIATNSSKIILTNNDLYSIIKLIEISKKMVKNIKQNLFFAFIYNICMIPIATGLFSKWNIKVDPMLGSIAMTLSSLTVVLNANRLRKEVK